MDQILNKPSHVPNTHYQPIEDSWPIISQTLNLSLVIPDTYLQSPVKPTSPIHTDSINPNTDAQPTSIPLPPSLKHKNSQDEENQIPKKLKFTEPNTNTYFLDPETVVIIPKEQLENDLKSERARKKNQVVSFSLFPYKKKSHGYSSEVTSLVNSLPNSEEGLAKPHQTP